MADTAQTLEDLTCAICVDHFRDPVKLPCQHTYCRECIRTHAEKSKPKETYDTSELSTIPKKEWLIYCPLCRKEASLGKDGVDDLPNNIYLCGMADRSRSLETVEEGACAETPENTVDQDLCMTHETALIMYCETCPKLICLECLEEHERHLISSTKAAYRNLKEPIQKKAEECEVFKDELACLVSETESLLKEIRENENTHRTEIESAYNEGLDVLNTWRRDALNRIENRHLPLTNKTERVLAELPVKMAEIEKMIQEALDLPTSLTGTFLQMSRDLTSRMDVHLSNAPDFLKDQRKVKKTVAETLKLDPVAPLNLDVKLNVRPMKGMGRRGLSQQLGSDLGTKRRAYSLECDVCRIETGPQIELPWLKFIKTSHKSLGIEAYGTMVCAQEGPAEWCEAWTDGCLQTGCNFWRLQVHLKPSSCERQTPRCIFTAGVRHKGSSLNGKAGVESWWVGISKYEDKSQVNSECGMVKERFRKWIPFQELYTLGFRLWCETGRLTIVDCEQNSVILTIDNVDVSKPLVPSVDFHGDLIQSASVSLVTGNSMALPSVLLSTV